MEGRLYDVKICYIDELDQKYLFALPPHAMKGQLLSKPEIKSEMYGVASELIDKICNGEYGDEINATLGSILVFLPGMGEIQELYDLLESRGNPKIWIIPLHSTLSM